MVLTCLYFFYQSVRAPPVTPECDREAEHAHDCHNRAITMTSPTQRWECAAIRAANHPPIQPPPQPFHLPQHPGVQNQDDPFIQSVTGLFYIH